MLEQFVISIQIIIIDIVMAADNAIIIGLIASSFAEKNRKRIIAWGVAAAFIFRVLFAFGATYILEFAWLKILGGVLLLWIVNNLRQDFFENKKIRSPNLKSQENVSFSQGFYKVLAESALRAIRICQPLRVPPTGYEKWKDLQLNFDANEMLKG
mgnify:CR=1 FL=1